jgi:hypothetical protein
LNTSSSPTFVAGAISVQPEITLSKNVRRSLWIENNGLLHFKHVYFGSAGVGRVQPSW